MHADDDAAAGAEGPAFILVEPQMGENIGAAARAMWNFGLDRLRVVAPRDGWPNPRAVAMASGAGRLLDHAGPFADLPAAIADCHVVYATTARGRGMTKPVLTPEEAMAQARAHTAAGRRVGVLFGPERAGLASADVARADAIVSVPVNPEFPSLNLAQCVLLTAYEWRRQDKAAAPVARTPEADPATAAEIGHLGDRFEATLDAACFFFPPEKAGHMRLNLRNMLGRLPLTRADVQLLHGALRQLARPPRGDV
ncbi:RNA methyltransferase [Alkalilacustris brevis]|uniref:RNA methyltransferase n=1 Tax=Alkalilacustris brevis TaxID=2026338 RepID=UPI000E0D93A9|nr:RNA methyltransferase [Alkalilacustris brevis]